MSQPPRDRAMPAAPPPLSTAAEPVLPFGPPDAEGSLVRRFERQVARHPERLAARVGDASISYAELDCAANRVARALLEALGAGAEPVALLLGPGIEQIAAHLGVLKAGKFCVPLDLSQPAARQARILADTGARAIWTDAERRERADALAEAVAARGGDRAPTRAAVLDATALPAAGDRAPEIAILPASLAYVFYTAGSTGEPKGVMQDHRNLLEVARLCHLELGLRPEDRVLCPMPLVYAGGVWGLLGALANGAALFRADTDGAGGLAAQIVRGGITVAVLMTSLLRQLLREAAAHAGFPGLRLVYVGGEVLHSADVARFLEACPGTTLLYDLGSTEAGIICHHRIDPLARPAHYVHLHDGTPLVSVGHPVEGVEVLLLDDGGRPAAPGETGEIAVRSEHLSPGYWRDPERTRAAFRPDPRGGTARIYATGDQGARLPDGHVLHLGRRDLQTKIRGQRIGTAEIEAALRAEPPVADAAVVAREDSEGDARLVAYVARHPGAAVTVSGLRRRLAEVLPAPMVPSAFVFVDALPLSPAGKVDRAALPEPGRERPPLDVAYAAPRTRLEAALAGAWAEVLALDQIGVDDDFLELGGHSLAAARLAVRLNERLGVDVPLASLLEAPTVAAQARVIVQLLAARLPGAELERAIGRIEAR